MNSGVPYPFRALLGGLAFLLVGIPARAQVPAPEARAVAEASDSAAEVKVPRWHALSVSLGTSRMLLPEWHRETVRAGLNFRAAYVHPVSRGIGLFLAYETQGLSVAPDEVGGNPWEVRALNGHSSRIHAVTLGGDLSGPEFGEAVVPFLYGGLSAVAYVDEPFRHVWRTAVVERPGKTEFSPGMALGGGFRFRMGEHLYGVGEGGYMMGLDRVDRVSGPHLLSARAGFTIVL